MTNKNDLDKIYHWADIERTALHSYLSNPAAMDQLECNRAFMQGRAAAMGGLMDYIDFLKREREIADDRYRRK